MPVLRRITTCSLAAALAVFLISTAKPAQAQLLTATLKNVTFSDGATATGSFTFDEVSNPDGQQVSILDADVTTSPGSSFAGTEYNSNDTYTVSGYTFPAFSGFNSYTTHGGQEVGTSALTDIHYGPYQAYGLYLRASPFQYEPGTYQLITSGLYQGNEQLNGTIERSITGGELVVTPAPEASSFAGLGLMTGAFVFVWRRQRQGVKVS